MIKGIDVSHHQSKFDTAEMKSDGLEFCILKCTQGPGDFVDPKFKERWKALKAAGIVRGAYHFFEAAADGVKQADFMIAQIKAAGGLEKGDLPPTLDWESARYNKAKYPVVSFEKQEANAIAFAKRIKEVLGVWPIFYTGRHRLAENKHSQFWADYCPLWIADYVPPLDIVAPYKKVHIWQRSDNAKRDADYSGGGDYNELQGDKKLLLSMTFGGSSIDILPDPPAILPVGMSKRDAKFIELARKESSAEGKEAERVVTLWHSKYQGKDPRYRALFNASAKDTTARLRVYDCEAGTVEKRFVAHGSGSDKNNDDLAESFSNEPGSLKTSLGIYRCGETNQCSKHGLEMKLDGLESTNSKARSRAIVFHRASYVNEAKKIAGRSSGCPAVDPKYADELIAKLKGGSPLSIYKG